jgi:hypothetical protein
MLHPTGAKRAKKMLDWLFTGKEDKDSKPLRGVALPPVQVGASIEWLTVSVEAAPAPSRATRFGIYEGRHARGVQRSGQKNDAVGQ